MLSSSGVQTCKRISTVFIIIIIIIPTQALIDSPVSREPNYLRTQWVEHLSRRRLLLRARAKKRAPRGTAVL
jgi:hypothetical protein